MNALVMNASGSGKGKADERKAAIRKIFIQEKPDVVLFQEFGWKDLSAKHWKENKIPEYYNIFPQEANRSEQIVYNTKTVEVVNIFKPETDYVLSHFPPTFKPLERLSMCLIVEKRNKNIGFICVSWHGVYKIKPHEKKMNHVQYLLQFLKEISDRIKTPVLIGGDFNITVDKIADIVKEEGSFEICCYKASERRQRIIDVLIKSKSLVFRVFNAKYVDLKEDIDLFDHDPITCQLRYDVDTLVWKIVEGKLNTEYFFQQDFAVSFALNVAPPYDSESSSSSSGSSSGSSSSGSSSGSSPPLRSSVPLGFGLRSEAPYSHISTSTLSRLPSPLSLQLSKPRITKFYDSHRSLKIVIVTMTDPSQYSYYVVCIYNCEKSFRWFWSDLEDGKEYAENIVSAYIMNRRGGNRGTLGILKTNE